MIDTHRLKIVSHVKRVAVTAAIMLRLASAAITEPDSSTVRMAILPFENLSKISAARITTMRIISDEIQAWGIPVVTAEVVDSTLRNNRIRDTGRLSQKQIALIASDTGARLILLGSIEYFEESPKPQVGFSMRLLDATTGDILWADSRYAIGDASLRILGLGQIDRIDELAKRELHQTVAAMATHHALFDLSAVRHSAAGVMIIPLVNYTTTATVNYVISDIFLTLISHRGYRVIEPGMVEHELRSRAVLPYGEIESESLHALASRLDAEYCVTGSINQYEAVSVQEGVIVPAIEIFARILEASSGKILWAGRIQRTGNDYATVLGIGTVLSPGRLLQLSANELLESIPARDMSPNHQASNTESSD